MLSAENVYRVFLASSTIAAIGFLSLIVQTLQAKCRKRKSRTKVDRPVALQAVTSGDEPQKSTTADGGSSRPGKAEPDRAWEKPLHDRIDALISQVRSQGTDDTPLEIARTAAVYLLAAESLLRLRHRGGGREKTRRTSRELNAAASLVVDDTTAATASLRDLHPADMPKPTLSVAAVLTGIVSFVATMTAFGAADLTGLICFDGQHVDLTRFTLRGEPRGASLPPYALDIAIGAAGRAFRLVLAGLGTILGLVRPVVMYPANAAFNCLASGLFYVGLPLRVVAVATISILAITTMSILAITSTAQVEHEELLENLLKDVDEQE